MPPTTATTVAEERAEERVDERVMVLLVLVPEGERVRVSFQYLHRDTLAWSAWQMRDLGPRMAAVCHRLVMANVRAGLEVRAVLERGQRALERETRRIQARTGCRPHFRRLVSPTVLHDASTLFAGYATSASWAESADAACARCGTNAWGASCTPPRFSSRDGRLVRDALDHVVAFCWTCLARRDLTHTAPQYAV